MPTYIAHLSQLEKRALDARRELERAQELVETTTAALAKGKQLVFAEDQEKENDETKAMSDLSMPQLSASFTSDLSMPQLNASHISSTPRCSLQS